MKRIAVVIFSLLMFTASAFAGDSRRVMNVDLSDQTFEFCQDGEVAFKGKVCTGKPGMETPTGEFPVLGKSKDYTSKKYGSKMPYAVRFTDDGHFLHQGPIKAQPSSHGCVRLSEENAKKVFQSLKKDDLIRITD